MQTFIRYESEGWVVYLRHDTLLVWVGTYATQSEALAVAGGIDGIA
jgi:hypothetical protein